MSIERTVWDYDDQMIAGITTSQGLRRIEGRERCRAVGVACGKQVLPRRVDGKRCDAYCHGHQQKSDTGKLDAAVELPDSVHESMG